MSACVMLVALALCAACRSAGEVRRVCHGLRPGTPRHVVQAQFRALGVTSAFVGESWFYQRSSRLGRRAEVCEVTFNRHDRLSTAFYGERPVL